VTVSARWLHISDFHLKRDISYDRDRVLGALIRSIPALIRRAGSLDFVIASGDIAFSGREEEYANATLFFDKLLETLGLPKDRLFIIPGNHDVDRRQNSALSRTLKTAQEADGYFSGDSELPHVNLRQSAFIKWYDSYFDGSKVFSKTSTAAEPINISINGMPIRLNLINSAVFSAGDDDHGKLLIGRRNLEKLFLRDNSKDSTLYMTVIHHPLSWLSMVESANVKALIRDNSDIILSGHLHETDIEQAQGLVGSSLHLSAGASYQGSDWPNTALICSFSENTVEVLPIQFVDRPRDTWTVDTSIYPEEPSFSRIYTLNRLLPGNQIPPNARSTADLPSQIDVSAKAKVIWEEDLFTTSTGEPIYVEPRLMPHSQAAAVDEEAVGQPINVSDIVKSNSSFIIETRSEFGGSNLSKRICYELEKVGTPVLWRDARTFPNYKAKIVADISSSASVGILQTLIFDNFEIEQHSRMLKELAATGLAVRVVLISVNRDVTFSSFADVDHLPFKLTRIYMWPFSRDGVRRLTEVVFETNDEAFTSRTVDKVYSDLLALCIPLTPPNVIMYLRVLVKEGDFEPLNRVHIHQRYISAGLSRASDMYRGNFNAKNKIDVIAAFAHEIYMRKAMAFSLQDWSRFCVVHKKQRLKEFDESDLLADMLSSSIAVKANGSYYFRYHFFFNFFLGRYFASNREEFHKFLKDESYLQVPAVIDVVTGLESENNLVLEHLTEQLNERLVDFGAKYAKPTFDPLLDAIWPDDDEEQQKLWNPVYASIEEGPRCAADIDELKSSIIAEARTDHQQVIYREFTDLENVLFVVGSTLSDALRNSDDALAELKLNALDTLLRTELVAFQVGTIFADKLSTQRFFVWGGALFVDFNKQSSIEATTEIEKIVHVVVALSRAVAVKIGAEIGTFKLANVFRSRAGQVGKVGFLDVLLFSCILESKGVGWADTLNSIIVKTGRNAFYLRIMLNLLMRNIATGMERGRDMEAAKRLVALIHSKRGHNKQAPGEKLVSKMLGELENKGIFKSTSSPTEKDATSSEGA